MPRTRPVMSVLPTPAFTPAQIAYLVRLHQEVLPVHPLTCGADAQAHRVLRATQTADGVWALACPDCDYRQPASAAGLDGLAAHVWQRLHTPADPDDVCDRLFGLHGRLDVPATLATLEVLGQLHAPVGAPVGAPADPPSGAIPAPARTTIAHVEALVRTRGPLGLAENEDGDIVIGIGGVPWQGGDVPVAAAGESLAEALTRLGERPWGRGAAATPTGAETGARAVGLPRADAGA